MKDPRFVGLAAYSNSECRSQNAKRLSALCLLRFVFVGVIALNNCLLAETPTPTPPAPAAAASATGGKEALIEVSVDSLEITENNTNKLGFLWGQQLPNGDFSANQVNFVERMIPSLFNVGQLDRN